MSGGFTPIDLSQLAAPDVVEALDYETILAEMKADLLVRDPTLTAVELESEPVSKLLEVCAYRELLIRQRVNDTAKAVMLAYAAGTNLDHLGALFGVERQIVDPGDPNAIPPTDPVYEDDARFRQRIQISLEGHSTAGSVGGYTFHALSADPDVRDVSVVSPADGEVVVTVLSATGDGVPSAAVQDAVLAALNVEDVRPLTDRVTVQAVTIIPYTVEATLKFYAGPDAGVVRQAADDAVVAYVADHYALGHDITLSGLYAALHQPGVQKVTLTQPVGDIVVEPHLAARCDTVTVTDGGIDE
ncbi:MAG: baseplate J/gp47 family protein [Chromatiales bacterium]|nr:baseplate J/gp47 family protein [Gammaproteobacteria bacterium]